MTAQTAALKSNISDVTRILRAGTSHAAVRLNERLLGLRDCRWRPLPDGAGLVAVDRRGRELASLYFEDAPADAPTEDAVAPGGGPPSPPSGGAAAVTEDGA